MQSISNATSGWHLSTKEQLSEADVFFGLLDKGLFAEKVPRCFISEGLSKFVEEQLGTLLSEVDGKKLKKELDKKSHDYIRYEAMRETNVARHIGIPHPESYAVLAMALAKNWELISLHCNKPTKPISRIFVQHTGNGKIFSMSYKGAARYKNEEEELLWQLNAKFVVKTDIASCFSSIYTHSIPWALHDKAEAKAEAKSPESIKSHAGILIDKCAQNTRDKQTNGLLIGPHSSSIISEIILTEIDFLLQNKNYKKILRHIDDYTFYAENYEEAEKFIRDLAMLLRSYEMTLNEKKTKILSLPQSSSENWIQALNRFYFPEEIKYSTVRSFLDLALEHSQSLGKYTPLNYAIKMLAGTKEPRKLNARAKRLYVQEVINLCIAFPYLTSLMEKYVFSKYSHPELSGQIIEFTTSLINIGIEKIYPDIVCHALYYAIKYSINPKQSESDLIEILALNDCLCNVLLYEYATKNQLPLVLKEVNKHSAELKKPENTRERDKNWLFIYCLWSVSELEGNGQFFLAGLKSINFSFINFSI